MTTNIEGLSNPKIDWTILRNKSPICELVRRYAKGRTICNCERGYYTNCGIGVDREGKHRTDMPCCDRGCDTNQIVTVNYVAAESLLELQRKTMTTEINEMKEFENIKKSLIWIDGFIEAHGHTKASSQNLKSIRTNLAILQQYTIEKVADTNDA